MTKKQRPGLAGKRTGDSSIMPLPVDNDALAALHADAERPEDARSSYWELEIENVQVSAADEVMGKSVLGSVSTKTGPLHGVAHWLLQAPFRHMGRNFRDFAKIQRLGRLIAQRQGRQFTHDMIRQALSFALVRHYGHDMDDGDCALVIGDGYGVLSSLNLLADPHRRVITVNLTKPLLLDLIFAGKAAPDATVALVSGQEDMAEALSRPEVRLIGVQADNAKAIAQAPIGTAFNIHSMQEMDAPVIAGYFDLLRNNRARQTLFYCCNKNVKTLLDGSESRFDAYPWHPEDQVLHDGICPWAQLSYSKKPPFWYRRQGGDLVTRHRLATMHRGAP